MHGEDHLARRERLVLQLARLRAVERVGAARAEALEVEAEGALADLLVGREADAEGRARELRVRREVRDGGEDLGHPGLVVGAQQRVPAARDDVVPDLLAQHRHAGRIEHGPASRQRDPAAVVRPVHERLDAVPRRIGRRVHVREQPDHRTGAGQRGEDEALIVERRVLESYRTQVVHEQPAQLELTGRARRRLRGDVALRPDAHIPLEALEDVGRERLGESRGEGDRGGPARRAIPCGAMSRRAPPSAPASPRSRRRSRRPRWASGRPARRAPRAPPAWPPPCPRCRTRSPPRAPSSCRAAP